MFTHILQQVSVSYCYALWATNTRFSYVHGFAYNTL